MAQIIGDFRDHLPACQEYLTIVLSPCSTSLQERWHHNGLSADFMADYFAAFFPRDEAPVSTINSKVQIKSAVSFIANELLENAMKFSDRVTDHPIQITLQLHQDSLVFLATNSIAVQSVTRFQARIREITTSDPAELIVRQLEKNIEDPTETDSGLGILTMMSDYFAKVGWKFETVQQDPEVITVTTMVYLMI